MVRNPASALIKSVAPLALWLLWASTAQAQGNFQPGYLIRPGGDTVRGEVAALGTQRSLRRCLFRATPTAEAIAYEPSQLRGYGVKGQNDYRTGRVPVADTAQALRFMEVLVRGQATLLMSSDDNNDPHFFLQFSAPAPRQELRLIVRTVNADGRVFRQEIKQYQQTLLTAFAAQPQLENSIRQARFGVPDLVAIFQKYNTATGGAVQVGATATAGLRGRFGVVAGLPLNDRMAIAGASSAGYFNSTLTHPVSPVGGVQLALNYPRLSRSLWLQLGAIYRQRNYTGRGERTVTVSSIYDDYYDLAYEASYIHLPLVLRLEPGRGTLHSVLELGLSTNLLLSQGRNEIIIHYTTPELASRRELFKDARTYEQGFLLGAGLTKALPGGHHASVVLRYELTNGPSSYAAISSKCSTWLALLSYDLVGK